MSPQTLDLRNHWLAHLNGPTGVQSTGDQTNWRLRVLFYGRDRMTFASSPHITEGPSNGASEPAKGPAIPHNRSRSAHSKNFSRKGVFPALRRRDVLLVLSIHRVWIIG